MEKMRQKLMKEKELYPDAISVGSSSSDDSLPPRKPVKRAGPVNVINSDSEDDQEIGESTKPAAMTTKAPEPRLGNVMDLTNPNFIPPFKVVPKPFVTEDEGGAEGINVEVDVTAQDEREYSGQTTTQIEDGVKDLFKGTAVNHEVERTEDDDIVPRFVDGFRLLPHQVQARHWMKEREAGRSHGGILADDMGLGKTIQTLVRIVEGKPHASEKGGGFIPSTLVIAPTSLATQWEEEIQRLVPSLRVLLHTGASRTRDPQKFAQCHVVITTYGTVQSEFSADPAKKRAMKALFAVKWWRVVLDEAHTIKNRSTKSAKACFELNSNHRWCLTGTPIQNKVDEFFSLVHFLRVKPLNDWGVFKSQIVDPLKKGRAKAPMKRLHAVLKHVMLRRSKDDTINGIQILDLPPKTITVVKCDFSKHERRFYDTLEDKLRNEIERIQRSTGNRGYMHALTLLLRLRQACDHPLLVNGDWKTDEDAVINQPENPGQDDDDDGIDLAKALNSLDLGAASKCQLCFISLSNPKDTHCSSCQAIVATEIDTSESDSAKIRKIVELVDAIEERTKKTEKIIIFSQFTTMLRLIQEVLNERGLRFVQFDGSMNQKERQKVVDKIKTDKNTRIILMSFKAGGVGLNLTACNNVILVDLWWNPALEDQAFGRAHRIGQKKPVNIWKLTIDGTVEERILALQDKKRELAESALSGEARSKIGALGMDELMDLFGPGRLEDDEEDD
ncbi:SNF2 family N-terminal domain-containing protein [Thelephora terrestris]|uniref:SNF2 family N-terminal domain-containing protein n=1 Tax=Thelephora terrestris TaxID=56493 RepID=A0A9P6L3Z2_9AGAM|nr:SNF2 family N-terminal domain-containing protein [Thelephora terrestris]